jgi:hypothetical protein
MNLAGIRQFHDLVAKLLGLPVFLGRLNCGHGRRACFKQLDELHRPFVGRGK